MAKKNLNQLLNVDTAQLWQLYLVYLDHGFGDENALKNALQSLAYFDSAFNAATETENQ
jgi:hypothetical protein